MPPLEIAARKANAAGARISWEITAEGDGTRYTATCRHWTETDCQRHAEMGFTDAWSACADQLKALAEA